jgi:hypothetical protein
VLQGEQVVDSCHRLIPFQENRKTEKQFCKFCAPKAAEQVLDSVFPAGV